MATGGAEIKCGVGFHPALNVFTGLFEMGRSGLLDKLQAPIMFLAGKNDPSDIKPGGLAARRAAANPRIADACVFETFTDQVHGWVNRGDRSDPAIKADAERALQMGQAFFDKHVL